MRTLRIVGASVALLFAAACSGSHVAPASAPAAATAGGSGVSPGSSATAATSTMTLTVQRTAVQQPSSTRRSPQTIPQPALSVDARVWTGSSTSGSPVATSCVNFPQSTTSATLTITVPQGTDTIEIQSWSMACSGSGGAGTTGTGASLSSFTGTGTVLSTSTNVATVFNSGTGIALATGGSGTPLTGPPGYNLYNNPTFDIWLATSLANAFDYPVQSGFDGTGQSIAIVIDSGVLATDLSAYLSENQTPTTSRTISYVSVDGASTSGTTADQAEATLDLETVAGLAPGANVYVYVVPNLGDGYVTDAYNQIISDNSGVHSAAPVGVVTSSFGGCETDFYYSTESSVIQAGAAAKIAFLSSAGDQGSACYYAASDYVAGVSYPTSDANGISVGGTESWNENAAAPSLTNPVAWDDMFFGSDDGTGGGISTTFGAQTYQSGISHIIAGHRNVPDVAMPAEGVGIYLNGTWQNYGGTSWSSPLFAAELAEIWEYCQTALANPVNELYTAYTSNPSAFFDITSGTNQYNSITPFYTAGTGYDNTTGLGVPLGMEVAETLCPGRAAPSSAAAAIAGPAVIGAAQNIGVNAGAIIPQSGGVNLGPAPGSQIVGVQVVLRPTIGIAGNEQTVIGILQTAGFTITQRFANHLVIDATASVSTVNAFFATTIDDVSEIGVTNGYAPAGQLTIPASIAPYVAAVSADNLIRKHAGPHRRG